MACAPILMHHHAAAALCPARLGARPHAALGWIVEPPAGRRDWLGWKDRIRIRMES